MHSCLPLLWHCRRLLMPCIAPPPQAWESSTRSSASRLWTCSSRRSAGAWTARERRLCSAGLLICDCWVSCDKKPDLSGPLGSGGCTPQEENLRCLSTPPLSTGELSNFGLVKREELFDLMYLVLGHGHESHAEMLRLDPPEDTFRVRLLVTLLDSCGQQLAKKKPTGMLQRFLLHLLQYTTTKASRIGSGAALLPLPP